MTLRQLIACASPLPSPDTVRNHLNAINCTLLGTAPDLITDSIVIQEENSIILTEKDDSITVLEAVDAQITESSDIQITSEEGDSINGLC